MAEQNKEQASVSMEAQLEKISATIESLSKEVVCLFVIVLFLFVIFGLKMIVLFLFFLFGLKARVLFLFITGWQKLHGSTGGTRRKLWTRTKILSPNIRYFVAN